MVSNDEDLLLFLEDLGKLLRKYHYDISPFTLRRITDPSIVINGFTSLKGDGILSPQYFKLNDEKRAMLGDENEN